jgi:hypothetical protein
MLKLISKFAMDILPSVVATIIGAYIVNHYIVTKPAAEAPVAAAVSPADPVKAQTRADTKSAATSADAGNIPEPGVKAKGISEKAMLEQTAAERPTVVEKSAILEKPSEKPADRPAETASIPADPHRHPPVHDKAVARSVTAPAVTVAPVEASVPVEEHRDANELARAAIERLRGTGDASPRAQEAARVPDPPRVVAAPSVVAAAPSIRPLPPPITVSTPPAEPFDSATGSVPPRTGYPAAALDDPRRPTPPADIPGVSPSLPSAGPLDLRAEVVEPRRREHTNVAEDMLLAAKSVFHAVLPQ